MNFEHANVKNKSFLINGETHPHVPFECNFSDAKKKDWSLAYYSIFENDFRHNTGVNWDYDDVLTGYSFFVFRLGQPNTCDQSYIPKRLGTPRLKIEFRTTTTKTYKLIMYAEWDEELFINNLRNVERQYSL